jgi:hypothetical protein
MTHRPRKEDQWYTSDRVWTNSRHDWDPHWRHKFGWPQFGADEWGRMVVTVGLSWIGYLSWAYRTCWKQCCHTMRQQTYDLEAERWLKHQEKIANGQCTCLNETIWRFNFWHSSEETLDEPTKIPKTVPLHLTPTQRCPCGHLFSQHSEDGDCQAHGNNTPTTP